MFKRSNIIVFYNSTGSKNKKSLRVGSPAPANRIEKHTALSIHPPLALWITRTDIHFFKTIIVLIFCFCVATGSSQTKIKHKTDWLGVNTTTVFAPAGFILKQTPAPQLKNMLCVKRDLPKLPFFCSMEDKFRNKFNIFLKLRAGTDDEYMSLIKSNDR